MSSERSRLAFLSALLALGCATPARTTAPAESPPSAAAEAPSNQPPEAEAPAEDATPMDALFLSAIPLRASAQAKALAASSTSHEDFARGLRVRIEVMGRTNAFGELSKRTQRPLVNGMFQLEDLANITSRDRPSKRDEQSTFIIDYDEAAFSKAVAEFERAGTSATPESISAFASRFISDKTYARGFDVASRVATTQSGDCTEHAVFTAALLRRFGFRARVVFGIVVIGLSGKSTQPDVVAFGHAWVEQHDGKRWNIVDSALEPPPASPGERTGAPGLPADVNVRLAYLPVVVLKDESAAYRRALMNQVGVDSVRHIDIDVRSGPARTANKSP